MKAQLTLEGESVVDFRIKESFNIIDKAIRKSQGMPLIIQFSGGKDSMVMLDLVRRRTDKFTCAYMVSGIEFPKGIDFVRETCEELRVNLIFSFPSDYLTKKHPENGFFERLEAHGYFPKPKWTWCSVYLKIRPQVRKLRTLYGKKSFMKLNGVRRKESSRRMQIYRKLARQGFMKPDSEDTRSLMVFPILNWTNQDVLNYIEQESIHVPTNPLYQKYGVSGCRWCAFYSAKIYEKILREEISLYDEFILWEEKLKRPSVLGNCWLRDIKKKVAQELERLPPQK